MAQQFVHAIGCNRFFPAALGITEWPKEHACVIDTMSSFLQIIIDQILGHPMKRDVAPLFALTGHLQTGCPTAFVLEILDGEPA